MCVCVCTLPCAAPSTMVGNESSAVSTMEKRQEALGGVGEAKEEESSIDPTHPNEHPVLKLPSLIDSLRVVERAVVQNSYQAKQALYRGLPVVRGQCVHRCTV